MRLNMPPNSPVSDHANQALGYLELGCYFVLGHPIYGSYFRNLRLGKFAHSVLGSFHAFSAQVSDGMERILGSRAIFQIIKAVVFGIPIQMINLASIKGRRANKGEHNKPMDLQLLFGPNSPIKEHVIIPLGISKLENPWRFARMVSRIRGYSLNFPKVANLITFIAGYRFPEHVLIVSGDCKYGY